MKIGPMDQLSLGTLVAVGNELGTIVKAELVESSNRSGMIVLHTVEFTHRKRYSFGTRYVVEALKKPKRKTVNYSFIQVVE